MKVFASSEYYHQFVPLLCESRPGVFAGNSEIRRYPNGEMYAVVHDDVEGEACLIVGTVAPPDEQLLALLTLVEAIKRNGAVSITVFLPYLGYARQDKIRARESGGIAFIGTLLRASGANRVMTIDIHSERDMHLIRLPIRSLSAAPLFAAAIAKLGWTQPSIVAPDEGAVPRAHAMARVFGGAPPVAHLVKRHFDGVVHKALVGSVTDSAVVVDDILDSGRTIISACEVLRQKGVRRIAVVVTHGLFSNEDWGRLFDLGVEALFVSESCPEAVLQDHPKLHLVSLAPLLPKVVSQQRAKEAHYERAIT